METLFRFEKAGAQYEVIRTISFTLVVDIGTLWYNLQIAGTNDY